MGHQVVVRVYFVSETAQVERKSGRVQAPWRQEVHSTKSTGSARGRVGHPGVARGC